MPADEAPSGSFLKKIPTTSISPTFKLTLPSDIAAANLESFLGSNFDLREARTQQAWSVSISRRRNKDKYEYLLMGWRGVCESLDVRCGDILEFNVFEQHMEFTVTRVQQKGDKDVIYTPSIESLQRNQSSSSSGERNTKQLQFGDDCYVTEEPALDYTLDYLGDPNTSQDTDSAVPHDHLLQLIMGIEAESGSKDSMSPSATPHMEPLPIVDDLPDFDSGNWGLSKSDPYWTSEPERSTGRQVNRTPKRKLEAGHASSNQKRHHNASPSHSGKSNQHCHPGMDLHGPQRSYGFPADCHVSGMMSYSSARCHTFELDELRAEVRKEQERASKAEARHAKLLYDLSGAESVIERQTTRGLLGVGQIFKAANRLVSRDIVSHVSLPVAQELGAYQVHLKQLGNDVLQALWQMRGLTQQKDVPAMHVAHHSLPSAYKTR